MRKSLTAFSAAALLLLTGCSSGETEAATSTCEDLDAAMVEEINFTLEAYGNGETITGGKVTQVEMAGAGTMPFVALIAAPLNKAGAVALWAEGEGGFIVPLNQEAISAMPDAAVEDDAVSQALNSPEGQATIACVQ
jgi:hypothetical protein